MKDYGKEFMDLLTGKEEDQSDIGYLGQLYQFRDLYVGYTDDDINEKENTYELFPKELMDKFLDMIDEFNEVMEENPACDESVRAAWHLINTFLVDTTFCLTMAYNRTKFQAQKQIYSDYFDELYDRAEI